MLAGGHGGVQVVVQQSADRGLLICGVVGGGASPGVFAEQVVETVPAAAGFADQVVVIQLAQTLPGGMQVGVVQAGSGVGVDFGAGVQAEPAEQALLAGGQVLVGQVERCRRPRCLQPAWPPAGHGRWRARRPGR